MNEALIVVILKPGKDKLLCGSYRPIPLLNNDAKILALFLQKVILSLITQFGFMPGQSTFDNIRRLYLDIHKAFIDKRGGLVLSLGILNDFY